jgi:hypothetical protein
MLRVSTLLCLPLFFIAAMTVAGCEKPGGKTAPQTNAAPNQDSAAKAGGPHPNPLPKGEGTASANPLPSGEAAVALTAADRELIAKQKVCPVSGQALGSMGDPIKVVVKGQTVFLCCSGCVEKIQKDPDKYLAKLKK